MLMAMGRIKLLVFVNTVGAVVMLAAMTLLAPRYGIAGAAAGRLLFGPIVCIIYIPLRNALRIRQDAPGHAIAMQRAL